MPLKDLRKKWIGSRSSKGEDATTTCGEVEGESSVKSSTDEKAPRCSLPLLQIWPSQDVPTGINEAEVDVVTFTSATSQGSTSQTTQDSGIDSVQASPSLWKKSRMQQTFEEITCPVPSTNAANKNRRKSSVFLHPNHALWRNLQMADLVIAEDDLEGGGRGSASSSVNSSMVSVACVKYAADYGGAWDRRRRSSAATRYSLLDALDLENALLRAATRNSLGASSLYSIHKLTFTQSLAFPALARGFANKRRPPPPRDQPDRDSGLNVLAKFLAVLLLVIISLTGLFYIFRFDGS